MAQIAVGETLSPSGLGGAPQAVMNLVRLATVLRAVRLSYYLLFAFLLALLSLVALATVPILFGYHTYMIDGSGAALGLRDGSVAVTRTTSPEDLSVGDVIANSTTADGGLVLQRIVEVVMIDGEPRFLTQQRQGDPNAEPFPLWEPIDKVVYDVPYAGHVLALARRMGFLLIGIPILLVLGFLLRDRWRSGSAETAPGASETAGQGQAAARLGFQPGESPLRVLLVAVPDFHTLMASERALSGLPAAKRVSIVNFRDDAASMEVVLGAPLEADELIAALRSAGQDLKLERSEPEGMALRIRYAPVPPQDGSLKSRSTSPRSPVVKS